jgi:hypothetical protein
MSESEKEAVIIIGVGVCLLTTMTIDTGGKMIGVTIN